MALFVFSGGAAPRGSFAPPPQVIFCATSTSTPEKIYSFICLLPTPLAWLLLPALRRKWELTDDGGRARQVAHSSAVLRQVRRSLQPLLPLLPYCVRHAASFCCRLRRCREVWDESLHERSSCPVVELTACLRGPVHIFVGEREDDTLGGALHEGRHLLQLLLPTSAPSLSC